MHPFRLLRALIATKLGACALCIRLSLSLSLASWVLFAALQVWIPASIATKLVLIPALGFTALFASHLVAYAVRVTRAYRTVHLASPASGFEPAANRRRFLIASVQAIGLALLPTVVAMAVPRAALAAPECLCYCKGCHCVHCNSQCASHDYCTAICGFNCI